MANRKAIYLGENWRTQGYVPQTDPNYPEQTRWGYRDVRDITAQDLEEILFEAGRWIDDELVAYNKEVALRRALDYAIKHTGHGIYDGRINARMYDILLARLAGASTESDQTLLSEDIRQASTTRKEISPMRKLTASEAKAVSARLDMIATEIEERGYLHGIESREEAYHIARELDEISDYIEVTAGVDKSSAVLEQDSDEPYMRTFEDDKAGPSQFDSDEPYMRDFENPDEVQGVYNRAESKVKDLNEYADAPAKQPSWKGKVQTRPEEGQYERSMNASGRYVPRTAAGREVAGRVRS